MDKEKHTNSVNVEEFVGFESLQFVFGLSTFALDNLKKDGFLDTVRQISVGVRIKYHFGDCIRRIAPGLTDFEVARLRIDVNERLLNSRKGRKRRVKKPVQ